MLLLVPTLLTWIRGKQMIKDFETWWSYGTLDEENPYTEDSPAFWAWEGWQAAMAVQAKQETENGS